MRAYRWSEADLISPEENSSAAFGGDKEGEARLGLWLVRPIVLPSSFGSDVLIEQHSRPEVGWLSLALLGHLCPHHLVTIPHGQRRARSVAENLLFASG